MCESSAQALRTAYIQDSADPLPLLPASANRHGALRHNREALVPDSSCPLSGPAIVPFEHNTAFGTAQEGCSPLVRRMLINDPANECAWKTIRRMNARPPVTRIHSRADQHARCLGVHKIPTPTVRGAAQSCDSILAPIQDSHAEYKIDFTAARLAGGAETARRWRTIETRLKRRGTRMVRGV
jgi:hypothetical protein